MEKTYLFIMVPTLSGSNILTQTLLGSSNSVALPGYEGLFLSKIPFPSDFPSPKKGLMFSIIEHSLRTIPDEQWVFNKEYWDSYWNREPEKPIKIEKTPLFICSHKKISEHFSPYKFLVMPRNPIAVAEGIMRNIKEHTRGGVTVTAEDAIEHAVRVILICDEVLSEHSDNSIGFTYEDFTENTLEIIDRIKTFIPELSDIEIKEEYDVKLGKYKMPITNLNDNQISRLNEKELKMMKEYIEIKKTKINNPNSFLHRY